MANIIHMKTQSPRPSYRAAFVVPAAVRIFGPSLNFLRAITTLPYGQSGYTT